MSENETKKGGISVETEHLFPIIKKWLYSEKEIFLRELVSNACDAVTKLKRLESLGQIHGIEDDYKITVNLDSEEKTLTVSDNGIGMNEEEVSKYICQIALSGALDFIAKYEGEDASNGIIGHFGLGFYSAFMVADKVEVITKSFDGSPAVRWVGSDSGEYEIFPSDKAERGTDIILHIVEDEKEYLNKSKIKEILDKYCSFMPTEIYLETDTDEKDDKKEEKENEPKPINDTMPLWQKNPSDCTDEEYTEFYRKVFSDYREPLFHIHINADYPLNFKGILFFPKLSSNFENLEGQVKLYYNQVFVSDNIKEVLPDYLLMLKGVIDCPELPLNVSRSYMQNSAYVRKMASHISKKVADKLNSLFNLEREKYESMWNDMKLFCEFACMRERKFYDKCKSSLLLSITDGSYKTVDEYLESAKEKHENTVYYANDKVSSAWFIDMYNKEGIDVALLDRTIDTQFISLLEDDYKITFKRVDSDVDDAFKGEGEEYTNEDLTNLFTSLCGEKDKMTVKYEYLKDSSVPAVLNISEEARRMEDMMRMYGMGDAPDMPRESTLILNPNSPIIKKLAETKDEQIAKQVLSLAKIGQRPLTGEELNEFLRRSYELLEKSLNS